MGSARCLKPIGCLRPSARNFRCRPLKPLSAWPNWICRCRAVCRSIPINSEIGVRTMSIKFPSDEWIKAVKDEVNHSSAYAEVAQTWEGAINFTIDDVPDSTGQPTAMWVDLWHGQCRAAQIIDPAQPISAAYTIHPPLANWK